MGLCCSRSGIDDVPNNEDKTQKHKSITTKTVKNTDARIDNVINDTTQFDNTNQPDELILITSDVDSDEIIITYEDILNCSKTIDTAMLAFVKTNNDVDAFVNTHGIVDGVSIIVYNLTDVVHNGDAILAEFYLIQEKCRITNSNIIGAKTECERNVARFTCQCVFKKYATAYTNLSKVFKEYDYARYLFDKLLILAKSDKFSADFHTLGAHSIRLVNGLIVHMDNKNINLMDLINMLHDYVIQLDDLHDKIRIGHGIMCTEIKKNNFSNNS